MGLNIGKIVIFKSAVSYCVQDHEYEGHFNTLNETNSITTPNTASSRRLAAHFTSAEK